MRRLIIGAAGGFALGYVTSRGFEALGDLRKTQTPLAANPKAYGRLRRRLMLAGIARSLAELGALAYGPAAEALAPPPGGEPRARRLGLMAGGMLLSTLLELPSSYVEDHVLERRYGLSKQSARDWAVDQAKSAAISTALSLPLLELLATAIAKAPRSWPYLATAGTVPLLVLANVLVPNLIAPLFNKFEALDGPLEGKLRELAARYGAGDAKILRVDMSKQTEKANAYVTGLFGSKRIVLGDTLLRDFAEDETVFVVAHELGHYVSRDVWRSVAGGAAAAAFVFFGARAIAGRDGTPLDSTLGLARTFFAASLLTLAAGPALAAFSRSRERAADVFALEATGAAHSGAAAFKRLRDKNMAEDEQPRWMELLFSSHPSLKSRIERLERVPG
jgi:Zn-dependent protease with chaperone function